MDKLDLLQRVADKAEVKFSIDSKDRVLRLGTVVWNYNTFDIITDDTIIELLAYFVHNFEKKM